MLTFEAMSREVCTAKRDVTATPLRRWCVLNDPAFVEAARVLAGRLEGFPHQGAARNRAAFRTLTGPPAGREEAGILARLFDRSGPCREAGRQCRQAAPRRRLPIGPGASTGRLCRDDDRRRAIMSFDEFVVER